MTSYLFPPVARYQLPLSLGQDLVVDFQNKDTSGNPLNYPDAATVTLVIDAATQVTVDADVSTYHAVCYLASSSADLISPGVLWRAIASVPGGLGTPETVDVALVNGTVVRSDGR
jgi:hypothetical protein